MKILKYIMNKQPGICHEVTNHVAVYDIRKDVLFDNPEVVVTSCLRRVLT